MTKILLRSYGSFNSLIELYHLELLSVEQVAKRTTILLLNSLRLLIIIIIIIIKDLQNQ